MPLSKKVWRMIVPLVFTAGLLLVDQSCQTVRQTAWHHEIKGRQEAEIEFHERTTYNQEGERETTLTYSVKDQDLFLMSGHPTLHNGLLVVGRLTDSADINPGPKQQFLFGERPFQYKYIRQGIGRHSTFLAHYDKTGTLQWGKNLYGMQIPLQEEASQTATTTRGNIYHMVYQEQLDTMPGRDDQPITLPAHQVLIQKIAPHGTQIWRQRFSFLPKDSREHFSIQHSHLTPTPNDGLVLKLHIKKTGARNTSTHHIKLIKLTADGEHLWTQRFSVANRYHSFVGTDQKGNIYWGGSITGALYEGATKKDRAPLLQNPAGNSTSYFLIKLNPQGKIRWSQRWGDTMPTEPEGRKHPTGIQHMAVNAKGQILLGGVFKDTIDMKPAAGTQLIRSGIRVDTATYYTTDPATGTMKKAFRISEQPDWNYFVAEYNSSGHLRWVQPLNCKSKVAGARGLVGLGIDQNGRRYVAFSGGQYDCQYRKNSPPATLQQAFPSSDSVKGVVLQFNQDGQLSKTFPSQATIQTLTVTPNGQLYIGGNQEFDHQKEYFPEYRDTLTYHQTRGFYIQRLK